jgi:hypothetical protein
MSLFSLLDPSVSDRVQALYDLDFRTNAFSQLVGASRFFSSEGDTLFEAGFLCWKFYNTQAPSLSRAINEDDTGLGDRLFATLFSEPVKRPVSTEDVRARVLVLNEELVKLTVNKTRLREMCFNF